METTFYDDAEFHCKSCGSVLISAIEAGRCKLGFEAEGSKHICPLLPRKIVVDRDDLVTRNWFTWRRLGWSPAANVARTTLHATHTPRFWQKLDGLCEFQNQE